MKFKFSQNSTFKELVPGSQYLEDAKFLRLFEGLRTKPIYYKIDKKWTLSGFIDRAKINEDKPGMITIELDKFTAKMLVEYKDKGYTPLNLALMFRLEGMYSYRLYELIRLWSNTKEIITYSIDELKEYFMLEDKKSYNTYANFKNKIIKPSIEELNETGFFEIISEEKKVGKKVQSLEFKVKDLDKRKYFDTLDEPTYKKELEVFSKVKEPENYIKKIEIKDFYVPNKKLFTARTLEMFKNDFENYDFKDDKYKKLLQESILIALEKNDEEKIKVKTYNYFKKTLENKIEISKTKPRRVKKTSFHNCNESFSNYDENELEKMLLENQKNKFK